MTTTCTKVFGNLYNSHYINKNVSRSFFPVSYEAKPKEKYPKMSNLKMQKISLVKKIYFEARLLINYLSSMEMLAQICAINLSFGISNVSTATLPHINTATRSSILSSQVIRKAYGL